MLKKIVALFIMIVLALGIVAYVKRYVKEDDVNKTEGETNEIVDTTNNIIVWYSYEYYKEYLQKVADKFSSSKNIQITLKYVNSNDMLKDVAAANKSGIDKPDIYLTGGENLEKAYLLGIVSENTETEEYMGDKYPEVAREAITYNGKMFAYPLGFETAAFVYNKKYVTTIPTSFDDIKSYADSFDSMNDESGTYDNVESILVWDADNMLYNYGFIGSYIDFSGNFSLKNEAVTIEKEKLKSALTYYKSLYDYFSLANEADNYEAIVDDFASGKIVFSILNIESLRELDDKGVEYGVCDMPDMDETLSTSMLAVTDIAIVNPYSDDLSITKQFANYLTSMSTYEMYNLIGILPCRKLGIYENQALKYIADNYALSSTLPRMLGLTDYWLKVENLFSSVNKNEDFSTFLDQFIEEISSETNIVNIK